MKAPKRPSKAAGLATYRAHVERARSEASAHSTREAVRTYVFAATCSGSVALGRLAGMPLAVIGMARDPDVAVSKLNARRHGACTPYGSLSQAFESSFRSSGAADDTLLQALPFPLNSHDDYDDSQPATTHATPLNHSRSYNKPAFQPKGEEETQRQ